MNNDQDPHLAPVVTRPRYAPHPSHLQPAPPQWVDTQVPVPEDPQAHAPLLDRAVDRVLAIQRPLVVAHLRQLHSRHPHASPAALARVLEMRYLATVTGGGAAVGAAAALPVVGTAAALALTSAETVGFLESTALYAQSLAELHGISLTDPDRARVLVLTLLLGDEGLVLLKQVTGQAKGGTTRAAFWGDMVSSVIPRQLLGPLVDQLKGMFLKKAATAGSASVIGKAMPYGIGAVIGGVGNHILARRVVARSRTAFGPAPHALPFELAEALEAGRLGAAGGARRAGRDQRILVAGKTSRADRKAERAWRRAERAEQKRRADGQAPGPALGTTDPSA